MSYLRRLSVLVLAVMVLAVSVAGAAELPSRLFPQVEKASFTDDQQPRWLHGSLGQLENGDIKAATRNYIDDRRQQFNLTITDEIEVVRSSSDSSGLTHIRLRQTHFDVPVEGADAWLHISHNGRVETFNGYLAGNILQVPVPSLGPKAAVASMQSNLGATKI
ncbi:MAG: hypothetical protein DRJ65_17585, partial [Acidobacteria bacterium]